MIKQVKVLLCEDPRLIRSVEMVLENDGYQIDMEDHSGENEEDVKHLLEPWKGKALDALGVIRFVRQHCSRATHVTIQALDLAITFCKKKPGGGSGPVRYLA